MVNGGVWNHERAFSFARSSCSKARQEIIYPLPFAFCILLVVFFMRRFPIASPD
jgi:hypothetical protein